MENMADKGEFYLKNYSYEEPVSFFFNGNNILLYANKVNHEKLRKLRHEEDIISEISILRIEGVNDKESLLNIAVDIKNLLSIGLGRSIVFDRQAYFTNEDLELVESSMSKNSNQGEQIIPDFEIENYLKQTLPTWINYSKEEKDNIFIITDYLNQTKHGFIEDRILRTVQAWECAATSWVEEIELSPELEELRRRVKSVYEKWKKEENYTDKDGELGNRLMSTLKQEKLMFRLDKLIKTSGLNTIKINLDLRQLKNLRDKVAHTGRTNFMGSQEIKFLQPGIIGLQLILLKRIGYDGLVNGEEDDWRTFNRISEYFE